VTECELCRAIVAWVADLGWEVYQEVRPIQYGRVADLVCTQDGIVWVIEGKVRFGFDVISQAAHWVPDAHYVSVATPRGRQRSGRVWSVERACLGLYGLGWLRVDTDGAVREDLAPRLNRHALPRLREALCESQKTQVEAGGNRGGYWTPFSETCRALLEYVRAHPGCLFGDAVRSIEHHYCSAATAKGSLRKWIGLGKVPGLCFDPDAPGRQLRLMETGAPEASGLRSPA